MSNYDSQKEWFFKIRTLQENRALVYAKEQTKTNLQHEQNKIQAAKTKLEDLNSSIAQKQALNKNLAKKTAQILGVKDYVTEKQLAIIRLQNEIKNKKTWLALADLMQSLFTNAQSADFKALKYSRILI